MDRTHSLLKRNGFEYFLQNKKLVIKKNNYEFVSLNLQPVIEGKIIPLNDMVIEDSRYIMSDPNHSYQVVVEVEDGQIGYWVQGAKDVIKEFEYFHRSSISAILLRTFVSDYHNYFANFEYNVVEIKSSVIPGLQQHHSGIRTWHMVPSQRAFAYKLTHLSPDEPAWFGFSIPGPLPLGLTKIVNWSQTLAVQFFSIHFHDYYAENNSGELPRIYFCDNLENPYAVLDFHEQMTAKRAFLPEKRYYDWWNKPIFCPGIDFSEANSTYDEIGHWMVTVSPETILEYVQYMEEKTGIQDFTVLLDGIWFTAFGDYTEVRPTTFQSNKKFREMVDALHDRSHRVMLWFSHFAVAKNSVIAKQLSEGIITYEEINLCGLGGMVFDYTHPKVREYIKKVLYTILSDEEGCLNADGIKLDLGFLMPDIAKADFYDPSWGVGDQLRVKVNEFITGYARSIKPDVCVSDTCLDPSVSMDVIRLNDEWTEVVEGWVERARKAIHVKNTLIDTDSYMMFAKKFKDYVMLAPVFGIPTFYSIKSFNGRERIQEEDYKRLYSSWNMYAHAPVTPDMEIVIKPEENEYYRKYTSGSLQGFYSAISFYRHCLVTYTDKKALVGAVKDMVVEIPIPPNVKVNSVKALTWDENYEEYPHYQLSQENSVVMKVGDVGKRHKWIEINFVSKH